MRLVTVDLRWWDTHVKGFESLRLGFLPRFDRAYSALIEDLEQRGLLASTLVIAWGEFGRTPRVNADAGRDHYPNVFSAALAGGPVKGGRVVGESDAKGAFPKANPKTPQDVRSTKSPFPRDALRAKGGSASSRLEPRVCSMPGQSRTVCHDNADIVRFLVTILWRVGTVRANQVQRDSPSFAPALAAAVNTWRIFWRASPQTLGAYSVWFAILGGRLAPLGSIFRQPPQPGAEDHQAHRPDHAELQHRPARVEQHQHRQRRRTPGRRRSTSPSSCCPGRKRHPRRDRRRTGTPPCR